MNWEMPGIWIVTAIACILLPPGIGLSFRWLHARRGSADCDALSCRQALKDFSQGLKMKVDDSGMEKICAAANLLFTLFALGMLALQMNLLPALFLQSFACLAAIVAALAKNDRTQMKLVDHAVKEFLLYQMLLFAAAVGFYLATGSFTISQSARQAGVLFLELPLLTGALLCTAYVFLTRKFAGAADGIFPAGFSGGSAASLNFLAEVYRMGFFLLFAALLMGSKGMAAAIAAAGIYAAMSWSGPGALRLLRRYRVERRWEYVLFAAGINLIWLYIKYL